MSVSTRGQYTSENAGMSSENYVGIIMAENPRFPGEGSSAQGKSGAKLRPKGVGDAQTAEIPSPPNFKPQGHLRITEPRRWLPGAQGSENIVAKSVKPRGEKSCGGY